MKSGGLPNYYNALPVLFAFGVLSCRMTPRRETLPDLFDSFAGLPQEFLLYFDGYRTHRYSYAQVGLAARSFAARLQQNGIQPGDRILFWSENRPEWIAAFWGCVLAGAVVVPVDYRASAGLLTRIASIAQAKLLLTGEEVKVPQDAPHMVWPLRSVEWKPPSPPFEPVQPRRDDLAEILFTSGATAEPKGVLIQHRNILANIIPVEKEILKYRGYSKPFAPIRFLNLLPLSHMFGQSMATFIPPILPGVVEFMSGYNPHDIVRQIRTQRISVLVCVPKILEVLREYVLKEVPEAAHVLPERTHWLRRWWLYRRVHRLFGWKFWSCVVGAAPLDPELEEFWKRLGYVVIQGYGLTETAPIVTLNHPFHTKKGTVGTPIGGVQVRVSEDGEILVRGENVTSGYLNPDADSATVFEGGWFRTGDIGELDDAGRLSIKGRKKEMIVTPEGLNVFPEDIERALNSEAGIRDSAVVPAHHGSQERVHAVLVLGPEVDAEETVRRVNARLEDHQKVRGFTIWPGSELPRTEGTRKLKRRELQRWVAEGTGTAPTAPSASGGDLISILRQYAPDRPISDNTTIEELGLSSLERVELLMTLERRFGVTVDEVAYSSAATVADLQSLVDQPALPAGAAPATAKVELFEFPSWNRTRAARFMRRVNLPSWVLPIASLFTWVRAQGLENLQGLEPPVIFAPNHQSHLDVPALMQGLPAKWRYRIAPAMSKEFFSAHFYPERHTFRERFTNSLNYYLGSLIFNAFPLPQREAGAAQTIRYAGELASEGWCIVIFPEGRITDTGEIGHFQPGVGLLASRLQVPVVPVRLVGLDKVLHKSWRMARPGRVEVRFGTPLRLQGEDYSGLAKQVEEAVRRL